jgi:hypothetical protein
MIKYLYTLVLSIILISNIQSQNLISNVTYAKDYFPGNNDINGNYLGSTETMAIIQHKGKLFAGMGNWMDYPVTLQHEGTQVLRKDAFNSPWVVDVTVGYSSLRSNAIASVFFQKDYLGNTLSTPVNLLVGGFSDLIVPKFVSVWVRNDINGTWGRNDIVELPNEAGIRSFCIHTDKVTGKQWLFCGITEGSIAKVAYNPNATNLLEVDPTLELSGLGRVMAMTLCNGDLYAAAGVELVGATTVGGLYRRIDGTNPTWELVYQWPYTPTTSGDEKNIMRGLTCVPDPLGSSNQVLLGTRANPGIVQVIQPFNNHNVYTEFDIRAFFANEWWSGTYNGPCLSAYNNFFPDVINGEQKWWMSLWVEHPNYASHPYNGSYYMQRSLNGTYKYGHVFDNNNPVPNNERLRATRTICKSPFAQDNNLVYYFGGYDCAQDVSNNTSWIYKGTFDTSLSVAENNNLSVFVYPNPTQNLLSINSNTDTILSYQIINSLGQIVASTNYLENQIDVSFLAKGLYLLELNFNGSVKKYVKFIKE